MIGTASITVSTHVGTISREYIPVSEAATLLGESRRTVDRRIASGTYRAVKLLGIVLLPRGDVEELQRARESREEEEAR